MQSGGVVADRFEIVAPAGQGGMGEVFRAIDRLTGETVALKIVRDSSDAERFVREAVILAELRHPCIVRYVAHGREPDGSRWLAMEWLEGEDLAGRLEREPLAATDAIELVRKVADALGAAHRRGVVHRDVKPSNLFLVGEGIDAVKLLDFGIARADRVVAPRPLTRTGVALGTPGYMAPEQVRGDRDVDARADVFSLGCVLFECLTHTPAFAGEHVMAILAKILLEEAPRLDDVIADAPAPLVEIVARMLAKERNERPSDGAEVARALGSFATLPSMRPLEVARRALTTGEQRFVCVVLAVREQQATVDTLAATIEASEDDVTASMRRAAGDHGAMLYRLADGTTVCQVAGSGAVEHAAQLALAFAAMASMRVVVATGRSAEARLPVGDAIDRAVRLLPGAAPVAVDELSASFLTQRYEIKGTRLVGARIHNELVRTLLGRPTPCVGRDRELRILVDLYRQCVEESFGRPVLVTAPAGVGKTRLAHELVSTLRATREPMEIWVARGDPTRAGSPLVMIKEVLKRAANMRDGESADVLREKIRARVARHVPEKTREHVKLFLGELTAAGFSGDASPALRASRREPIVMADNMRRAWEDFVIAECTAHPVVMVLEDLHWGDGATVSYVDSALRNLGERPWLVLALARPEVHELFPKLWAERGLEEHRLQALSRKASEKLVRAVLGDGAAASRVATIVDRAAGNAFFLEELMRVTGQDESVPETVLAIVEQRLLGIDAEARRVLRAASVLGGTFWEGCVEAMVDVRVRDWLDLLSDAELVYARTETRFAGEREYAFRHDVVRAAANAMLTDDDRLLGHKLAAEWLEAHGESDALTVAEHFEKGGERSKAASFYLGAAKQAFDGQELTAAVERAQKGIACGASGDLLGQLRLVQAEAHHWSGGLAEMEHAARDAMTEIEMGTTQWYDAMRLAIVAGSGLGHRDALVSMMEMLEATPAAAGAEAARARTLWQLVASFMFQGELERARRLASSAGDVDDDLARAIRAGSLGTLALHEADVVKLGVQWEKAAELYARAGDTRRAAQAASNVGYAYALHGDYARAEVTLRHALDEARRVGLRRVEAAMLNNIGPVLAALGRGEEAQRLEREAVTAYAKQGDKRMEGGSRTYLAHILCDSGDSMGARIEARRAIEILGNAPPLLPDAFAALARAELLSGDVAAARIAIDQAMQGIDAVEEGESKIRLTYAEVLHAQDDTEGARVAIAEARERLLARAAKISDEQLRASFLERVPENARTLTLFRAWQA